MIKSVQSKIVRRLRAALDHYHHRWNDDINIRNVKTLILVQIFILR